MTDKIMDQDELELFAQTEGLQIDAVCADRSMLRFIDVEASSLAKDSYPIEYGSCGLDLKPSSFLIKRKRGFALRDWSTNSQKIHNISLEELEQFGIDADEAVSRIKLDLAPGVVGLSDNAGHDSQWLIRLSPDLEALDIYPLSLFLRQARKEALERHGYQRLAQATIRVQEQYPHIHRAGPDSLRMAALFKLLVDDEFVDHVLMD